MKDLKAVLFERLKINQDTYKLQEVTLLTFVRWFSTAVGESKLKPEDKLTNSNILFALLGNDKNYSKTDELVNFFNENKNNHLENLTEEKLYENNKFKGFIIKFSIDNVNFNSKAAESFLEFLDKNQVE